MRNIKRLLQVNLFVLVLLSSFLLGMAMESSSMILIALTGATLGFVVTDLLKLFQLKGLIANIASLLILFLAMRDFFPEDGTGKLISVANLLVYLQTVLMFQEKTPRLNWQILILSLLQVVVSAIFSLDLEGGMLLLSYFVVVGSAMYLQSIYAQQFEIGQDNQESAVKAHTWFSHDSGRRQVGGEKSSSPSLGQDLPLTFVDYRSDKSLRLIPVFTQLLLWATIAISFTLVMFYLAPRHAPPWYGPMTAQVTTAGVSKSVNLDERDIIELSNQLMFRVSFRRDNGSEIKVPGAPYFRGLALSDLVVRDGKTDWRAPQDRIVNEHYQDLPRIYAPPRGTPVYQIVTLEETEDPLVYGVFPFFRVETTPRQMEFCHEISGLTRCKIRETINLAPYKYQAATILDSAGRLPMYWPYISNTKTFAQRPMAEDEPQVQWLTKMDPERYEAIVRLSERLADENRKAGGSMLDLFRKMEDYFQSPGQFRYTLDFRRIKRDESLDPVEDFVRNHRSGHCELFASALTLMLRHQKIPARVVVGFRGGSYNSVNGCFMVRANNAHAWVEAYLPPEECTQDMLDQGQAGPGGAWAILEPTPISLGGAGDDDEAIDIARSVWDDYVLGMDNENSQNGRGSYSVFAWMRFLDIDNIDTTIASAKRTFSRPWVKFGIPGIVMLFIGWLILRNRRLDEQGSNARVSLLRRVVASAISLISPELSKWVMGRRRSVEFYEQLVQLLQKHGLTRQSNQTHREFARQVVNRYQQHPQSELIRDTVTELTERFNEVRFGRESLDEQRERQLRSNLRQLASALDGPAPSGSVVTT